MKKKFFASALAKKVETQMKLDVVHIDRLVEAYLPWAAWVSKLKIIIDFFQMTPFRSTFVEVPFQY